ncbi:MAG: cytochrome c biogenesis protein ResB, partial [Allobranchiibius sp.]
MSSAITQPKLGFFGTLRWTWRQLTSMRTALFLLLLIAVAAIPGSIIPQTGIDARRVAQYKLDHTTLAPVLGKLGFFNVFVSPWFAAIYLLLLVSLVGCVLPRVRIHLRNVRAPVPRTPKNLSRLPAYVQHQVEESPDVVLDRVREVLRRKRYRVREDQMPAGSPVGSYSVAAEAGRMRETGNLIFHSCLIAVVLAVAAGHLWGWRADVIVPVGGGFANAQGSYDTVNAGPLVDTSKFLPWRVDLNRLDVTFEDRVPSTSPQYGQPRNFTAYTTVMDGNKAPVKKTISVNDSLSIGGSNVYLLGNGYAPKVTVRGPKGNVLYSQATPFLAHDNDYKSTGAIKVTTSGSNGLGFNGFFLPTAAFSDASGPVSTFPALKDPALVLAMFKGNLFPGDAPQSVYTLDPTGMKQVRTPDEQPVRLVVKLGQTVKLPGNAGTITL